MNEIWDKNKKLLIAIAIVFIITMVIIASLPYSTTFSSVWSSIIGGFISGGITFFAMHIIDERNRKRWLNDEYVKNEAALWLNFRNEFIDFRKKFKNSFYEQVISDSKNIIIEGEPVLEFHKRVTEVRNLIKLQEKIEPFMKDDEKELYKTNHTLLGQICGIYTETQFNLKSGNYHYEKHKPFSSFAVDIDWYYANLSKVNLSYLSENFEDILDKISNNLDSKIITYKNN